MTWKILYSKTAIAFYSAVLWGRTIADTFPNQNHATTIEAIYALVGSLFLIWIARSWHSVVLIPVGYAIGMLFVAVGPWGNLDITFAQSLVFVLLTFIGSAVGNLIIQIRQQHHQTN